MQPHLFPFNLDWPSWYTMHIEYESENESCSVVSDSLWPYGLYSPRNFPGQNTRVGSPSLFQDIFPTRGSNPSLPHCRQILYQLSHKGSTRILEWVAYPFSRGSSRPRNQIGVSCIAGGFFTNWASDNNNLRMLNLGDRKLWSLCLGILEDFFMELWEVRKIFDYLHEYYLREK